MAQTDSYEIENKPDFKLYRLHANELFAALRSGNAGPEPPATTYAYMTWVKTDGADWEVYQRNANNTAWVLIYEIRDGALVVPESVLAQNNLSDLDDIPTARDNLGLGSAATEDVVPIDKGGTGATTAAAAMDALVQPGMVVQTVIHKLGIMRTTGGATSWTDAESVTITPRFEGSTIVVSVAGQAKIERINNTIASRYADYRVYSVSLGGNASTEQRLGQQLASASSLNLPMYYHLSILASEIASGTVAREYKLQHRSLSGDVDSAIAAGTVILAQEIRQ